MFKILFFNLLIMGTLISISSFNWLGMWMGLELNLLSFIPLMMTNNNLTSEASLKYFIIQVFASMLIISSFLINSSFYPLIDSFNNNTQLILNTGFLLKMGAAPFHFWFPEIIEGLDWLLTLTLLTWQKIAPMILISYNSNFILLIFSIFSCLIVSSINGWNQTSMKKILTFSSINHIGWMLALLLINQSIWLIYFLFYTLLTFSLILIFNLFNITFLNQIIKMMNNNKLLKLSFFLIFFSLGGLPPFMGFLPKWIAMFNLMQSQYIFLIFFMVTLTLLTLYYYIRTMLQALLLTNQSKPMFNSTNYFMAYMLNFFNFSLLISFTFMMNQL
uniref:NADH-ubiquinone oxidoreductase chain 2 n=1 Tax=Rodolia quadrimaculata TaxID=2678939 RepID=A0A6B9MYU0_9CUCU|nr:NADH dehydrogenase subunit 2 [Rodolia quadrimaculata]